MKSFRLAAAAALCLFASPAFADGVTIVSPVTVDAHTTGVAVGIQSPVRSAPAQGDVLGFLQGATLADIKTAEAIYAANPTVPTAPAAAQCLGWADAQLSSGIQNPFNVQVPTGVVSSIADLDVALSTANTTPPIINEFNKNCAWYVEQLKAEAVVHAGGIGFNIFGLKL
jgi:hypothetical protein